MPDWGSPGMFCAVPIRDLLFADWGRPMLMLPSASRVLYDCTITIVMFPTADSPGLRASVLLPRSMLQYSV